MSDLVSLCVLRLEVSDSEDDSGKHQGAMSKESAKNLSPRSQRIAKEISVQTFPSRLESQRDDWNLLPPGKGERLTPDGAEAPVSAPEHDEEIGFFSGNPFVEVTKGTLHLYKEDALRDRKDALCLCLLGVPAAMTCHDLLAFTAPCHADIAHIRVLRDTAPNQYMALLVFRTHAAAAEFHATYDGAPYSGLEPERVCRAVWVSRVEWTDAGAPPPAGHTELPTCPVCLERMDESVDGVLTILCNHAFHAECLVKWGDSTCPVCRCVQSPELAEEGSECVGCGPGTSPVAADSLWICLVCGHIGCGRYQGGHAAKHYRDTGHCYALQLGSHRVWDYKGDNFVHRLLQNKADGKLVPSDGGQTERGAVSLPGGGGDVVSQDKVDSVQLEYTYLLTSQLDSQRRYFEDRLARLENSAAAETDKLREQNEQLNSHARQLEEKVKVLNKEKQAMDRKATQLTQKLTQTQTELNEERQLGKALRANQQQWQNRVTRLETKCAEMKASSDAEIAQLKEQLRDLMFYLDAQQMIANSEERDDIAGGTVTVGATDTQPAKATKNRNRRKR